MRTHSSGRVTSFVTERDGVLWRKILHLTGYDVSDAVRTTLALDISMSKYYIYQYMALLPFEFLLSEIVWRGHAVAQLVEALRYKPDCRGFDSRWCHWNFLLI
jgi:hypothetical protein